jgi:heme exporter protein CcmD
MNDFYIWGSYAVTFVLLAIEVVLLRRRARIARRQLDETQT